MNQNFANTKHPSTKRAFFGYLITYKPCVNSLWYLLPWQRHLASLLYCISVQFVTCTALILWLSMYCIQAGTNKQLNLHVCIANPVIKRDKLQNYNAKYIFILL